MPRREPLQEIADRVRKDKQTAMLTLCAGQWEVYEDAHRLVGEIKAYNNILDHMRTVAGPGTEYGEQEL